MRITTINILLLFCIGVYTSAYGQRKINLSIDTSCFTSNGVNGTLGLYTNISQQLDTLVQEVEIVSNQEIVIENAHETLSGFRLVYTPADTLLPKNQYIIGFYESKAYLSCYFFNESYPSFIEQLQDEDTLFISSKYIGNTGDLRPMTTYTFRLCRLGDKYYASFRIIEIYPNHVLSRDEFKSLYEFGDSFVLNKNQLKRFKKYEEGIFDLVDNKYNWHYENSFTTVEQNNKTISFFCKGYMALELWNYLELPQLGYRLH